MSLQSVLQTVPKPARTTAAVFVAAGVVIGPIAGYIEQLFGNGWVPFHGIPLPILGAVIGLGLGLFIGCLFAIWVLGLGYVYADARRRDMPHIPWTLVAAIVPNLLGFLLYFVLRKPLASPCPQCGQPIAAGQRFCPSCGCQALPQSNPTAPPQTI